MAGVTAEMATVVGAMAEVVTTAVAGVTAEMATVVGAMVTTAVAGVTTATATAEEAAEGADVSAGVSGGSSLARRHAGEFTSQPKTPKMRGTRPRSAILSLSVRGGLRGEPVATDRRRCAFRSVADP